MRIRRGANLHQEPAERSVHFEAPHTDLFHLPHPDIKQPYLPVGSRQMTAIDACQCCGRCLRYCLSYRDVEELMRERGLAVDHSTIARWVLRRHSGEFRINPGLPVTHQA